MMWLLNLLAPAVELYSKWFGSKNSPQIIKAKEINDERTKEDQFKDDLVLAKLGNKDALERIRARIAANP